MYVEDLATFESTVNCFKERHGLGLSKEGLAEEAMECASASVLKAAKMEHTRYVGTR